MRLAAHGPMLVAPLVATDAMISLYNARKPQRRQGEPVRVGGCRTVGKVDEQGNQLGPVRRTFNVELRCNLDPSRTGQYGRWSWFVRGPGGRSNRQPAESSSPGSIELRHHREYLRPYRDYH